MVKKRLLRKEKSASLLNMRSGFGSAKIKNGDRTKRISKQTLNNRMKLLSANIHTKQTLLNFIRARETLSITQTLKWLFWAQIYVQNHRKDDLEFLYPHKG